MLITVHQVQAGSHFIKCVLTSAPTLICRAVEPTLLVGDQASERKGSVAEFPSGVNVSPTLIV